MIIDPNNANVGIIRYSNSLLTPPKADNSVPFSNLGLNPGAFSPTASNKAF